MTAADERPERVSGPGDGDEGNALDGAAGMAGDAVGCAQNAIGILAVISAGVAVLGYVAALQGLGAKFGPALFVGGTLLTVSAALNVSYWGYRLTGSEKLAKEYERGLKFLLAP
ncbi:MAG: hypothetical protein AAF907_09430, partial [Planctomycetota bacterium]